MYKYFLILVSFLFLITPNVQAEEISTEIYYDGLYHLQSEDSSIDDICHFWHHWKYRDVNPTVPVLWVFCLIHVIVTWA